MPAWPLTVTSRALPSRAVAWKRSFRSRSSSSRPTNGGSSVAARPLAAAARHDRHAPIGGDRQRLAFQLLLARPARRRWHRPRRDRWTRRRARFPARAADCSRDAVLTRSPATMPWLVAPMVTAASPVSSPARACSPCSGSSAATAATSSRPARTARSASSSWAVGAPHTAITASPMNFSMVPPWRSTICGGRLEVPAEQLARLLRVARLRERGEPDQVVEENRHQSALGTRASRHRRRPVPPCRAVLDRW